MDYKDIYLGGEPDMREQSFLREPYSIREGLNGWLNGLSNGEPYIINGCEVTQGAGKVSVTGGTIFIDGRQVKVEAQIDVQDTEGNGIYQYAISTSYDAQGTKTYLNNILRETYRKERGVVTSVSALTGLDVINGDRIEQLILKTTNKYPILNNPVFTDLLTEGRYFVVSPTLANGAPTAKWGWLDVKTMDQGSRVLHEYTTDVSGVVVYPDSFKKGWSSSEGWGDWANTDNILDYYDSSLVKSQKQLKHAIFEIGGWNMESSTNIEVSSPLTREQTLSIVSISAQILEDVGEETGDIRYSYPIDSFNPVDLAPDGGVQLARHSPTTSSITEFILWRNNNTNNQFDKSQFNNASINRGYILVSYFE